MTREPTESELEMIRNLHAEKLEKLTASIDVALQMLFKKRMGFCLVIIETDSHHNTHMHVTNVDKKEKVADILKEIIDMIKNPKPGEEGTFDEPTIQ